MAEADPIKAAEALAGSTYTGAQERTAASKKALLDGLAAQGTYQNTINQAATQAAAPQPVATRPGDASYPQLGAMSHAGADQTAITMQAAQAAAAALAAHQATQRQQANATYFDQVSAATPIEQSRAQSQAAQIYQQLIDEREQRANAVKLQQLQLQETQARIAHENEQAAAKDAAGANPLSPNERIAVEGAALQNSLPADVAYDAQGNPTKVAMVTEYLASNPGTDLAAYLKSAGLNIQEQNTVVQGLNNYTRYLAGQGYYGNNAAPTYTNPLSAENDKTLKSMLYLPVGGSAGSSAIPSRGDYLSQGMTATAPKKSTKGQPRKGVTFTPDSELRSR